MASTHIRDNLCHASEAQEDLGQVHPISISSSDSVIGEDLFEVETVLSKRSYSNIFNEGNAEVHFSEASKNKSGSTACPTPDNHSSSAVKITPTNEKKSSTNRAKKHTRGKFSKINQVLHIEQSKCVRAFRAAFNVGDADRYTELMNKYWRDDVVLCYQFIGPGCPHSLSEITVNGRNAVRAWWLSCFLIIPDILFQPLDVPQFVDCDTGESIATMNYEVSGTKSFEVTEVVQTRPSKYVSNKKDNPSAAKVTGAVAESEHSLSLSNALVSDTPLVLSAPLLSGDDTDHDESLFDKTVPLKDHAFPIHEHVKFDFYFDKDFKVRQVDISPKAVFEEK